MAFNDPAIILAAYGTGAGGMETYRFMDRWFVRRFKNHRIVWAFTSGFLLARARPQIRHQVRSLEDAIEHVTEAGESACVVQSLHVWAAGEYHEIISTLSYAQPALKISVGAPLIMDPSDFDPVMDLLGADLTHENGEGVVLIAHGTGHSSIALYKAFGKRVRERFGETVWMELVREPEGAIRLKQRATDLGIRKIRFVPLMMVAGRHVLKDVMGEHIGSWRSELLSVGVESRCEAPALGYRPEVLERFCERIGDALEGFVASGEKRCGTGDVILPKGSMIERTTAPAGER